MSAFGVAWLLFGLLIAIGIGGRKKNPWRVVTLLALYAWHTALCFAFWSSSLDQPLDANVYYWSAVQGAGFGLGTGFVTWFSWLQIQFAQALGLDSTYLDQFLLNNVIGYVGVACIYLTLQHATRGGPRAWRLLFAMLVFLPGLSYWSCAIGKDSFSMLGIGLACLATTRPSSAGRHLRVLLAVAIVFLVRPHIAAVLLGSYGTAMVVQGRRGMFERGLALVLGAAAAPIGLWVVERYLGITADAWGVMSFLEARQSNIGGGSYIDLTGRSPPYVIFTYLFRPLFFDAPGLLGMAASVENAIILSAVIVCLVGGVARANRRNLVQVVFSFSFIYFAVATPLLAFATPNLGLAVRQKSMVLPAMYMNLAFIVAGGAGRQAPNRPGPRRTSRFAAGPSARPLGGRPRPRPVVA